MTRILLDQGIAPHAAILLREFGFSAIHVSEIGMEKASDLVILNLARDEDRVCVTMDHDFHAHLAAARHGRPSVILLRLQGVEASGQAKLIRFIFSRCADALKEGAAVSADQKSIRVRRLPLR